MELYNKVTKYYHLKEKKKKKTRHKFLRGKKLLHEKKHF